MSWASYKVGGTPRGDPGPCRTATRRLAVMGIADMERAPRPQLYRAMGGTVRDPIGTEVSGCTQVR